MRRKLLSFTPHKAELKDEHVLMATAYGGGAFFTHTMVGMIFISLAYMIVFMVQIHDIRRGEHR